MVNRKLEVRSVKEPLIQRETTTKDKEIQSADTKPPQIFLRSDPFSEKKSRQKGGKDIDHDDAGVHCFIRQIAFIHKQSQKKQQDCCDGICCDKEFQKDFTHYLPSCS